MGPARLVYELPGWRNWQTRKLEVLVSDYGRAGSNPVPGNAVGVEANRRNDVVGQLTPFIPRFAADIATWVRDELELRWLAPSAAPPLTASQVLQWQQGPGHAYCIVGQESMGPLAYGELKPMRRERNFYWLGHVIVHPVQRDRGLGRLLVAALVAEAFDRRRARRVSLVVFPENRAAIRCYRRVGFRIVGEEYHRFGREVAAQKLVRLEIEPGQEVSDGFTSSLRAFPKTGVRDSAQAKACGSGWFWDS